MLNVLARFQRVPLVRGILQSLVLFIPLTAILAIAILAIASPSQASGSLAAPTTPSPTPGPSPTRPLVPMFDHIFVILEENHGYDEIMGNPSAPYLNSLATENAVATNYMDVGHPSLPNYLALAGGSTFGITNDCKPADCSVNAPNVADRIEASRRSWRGYMDSMPEPCLTEHSGNYAPRHNPFVYFRDITSNPVRCASHVVPYPALALDLQTALTTPNLVWITPDLCHDMHDCPAGAGDAWLAQNLPAIFNSPAWTRQRSVMFILWDEGTQHHVPALVIGPAVKPGYQSPVAYTHYSFLRTVQAAWGLSPLTQNDANATVMSDFWK